MGEEVAFTKCVCVCVSKLCSAETFLCVQQNTAVAAKKVYVEETEIYENSGLLFEHGQTCFCLGVVLHVWSVLVVV